MNNRLLPTYAAPFVSFLSLAAALLLILVVLKQFAPAAPLAHAQVTTLGQLSGSAWSDTIGWINFDSTVVTIQSNNTITGYAWSENIGWVSFNAADTASCGATAAQISGTTLSGWAKAPAADNNGWDGCISLSGVTLPGGTSASGNFSGNAWGSDVVGWVSFSGVAFVAAVIPPPSGPTPLLSGPTRVRKGTTATLTYTVTTPPVGGCIITGTNGYNSGVINPTDGVPGTVTTTAITVNTGFTITCSSTSASTNVGIIPVFDEI